jgi:hypothetical protein
MWFSLIYSLYPQYFPIDAIPHLCNAVYLAIWPGSTNLWCTTPLKTIISMCSNSSFSSTEVCSSVNLENCLMVVLLIRRLFHSLLMTWCVFQKLFTKHTSLLDSITCSCQNIEWCMQSRLLAKNIFYHHLAGKCHKVVLLWHSHYFLVPLYTIFMPQWHTLRYKRTLLYSGKVNVLFVQKRMLSTVL